MSDPNLWGKSPRGKIRGTYDGCDYSPAGTIGPREAGSIFANVAMIQSITIPISYEIETLAAKSYPGLPTGVAGIGVWLFQTLFFLALKIGANLLRNYGASLLRDLGAWLWLHFLDAAWQTFWQFATGWIPWNRKQKTDGETIVEPGFFRRLFGARRLRRRKRTK